MDRGASESADSETLITTRGRHGDVDIDLGRRGHIRIDDSGEGDRVLMGDDITVEKDEVVEGDAVAIGGNVTVLGKVMGDAVAIGGNMILGDSAYVAGDAVSVGGGIEKSKSAYVGGESCRSASSSPSCPGPSTTGPCLRRQPHR